MTGFLLVSFVPILVAAFLANLLLNLIARFNRPLLICVTLTAVGIGAYAASFVSDMAISVWAGELTASAIVWPCFTWSLIASSLLVISAGRSVPFMAFATPFWLLGGIALFSSFIHPRNIITAILLVVGGVAYGSFAAQRGASQTTSL